MSEVPLQWLDHYGGLVAVVGTTVQRFRAKREIPERAHFRGTSLIRNSAPLRPYSKTMPRGLWWP